MVACYRCGASPNNPNKALDTLKLIQCMDCGVIACTKHRKGILGGQCAECGSPKSTIVAMKNNVGAGGFGGGGFGGGGGTAISKSTLQSMQDLRKQAAKTAQDKINKVKQNRNDEKSGQGGSFSATMGLISSTIGKLKTDHEPKDVQKLLGTKKVIMDSCAVETVDPNKMGPGKQVVGSLDKNSNNKLKDDGSAKKLNTNSSGSSTGASKPNTNNSKKPFNETTKENRVSSVMMAAACENFETKTKDNSTDKNPKSNNSNKDSKKTINKVPDENRISPAMMAVACENFEGKDDSSKSSKFNDDKELITTIDKVKKNNPTISVNLKDNFFIYNNLNIEKFVEQKKEQEQEIIDLLAEEYDVAPARINLKLSTNIFISLEDVDRFLIMEDSYFKENNIQIITGFNFSNASVDLVEFLEQFKQIAKNKSFITGVYGAFAENYHFDYSEQKNIMYSLLDIASESNKTFYIGNSDDCIELWKDLFSEYDLIGLKFIQTKEVTDQKNLDFINNNNILPLITNDIDFNFYKEHFLEDSRKLYLGSCGNNIDFLDLLKNISLLDENFIEKLRK